MTARPHGGGPVGPAVESRTFNSSVRRRTWIEPPRGCGWSVALAGPGPAGLGPSFWPPQRQHADGPRHLAVASPRRRALCAVRFAEPGHVKPGVAPRPGRIRYATSSPNNTDTCAAPPRLASTCPGNKGVRTGGAARGAYLVKVTIRDTARMPRHPVNTLFLPGRDTPVAPFSYPLMTLRLVARGTVDRPG